MILIFIILENFIFIYNIEMIFVDKIYNIGKRIIDFY